MLVISHCCQCKGIICRDLQRELFFHAAKCVGVLQKQGIYHTSHYSYTAVGCCCCTVLDVPPQITLENGAEGRFSFCSSHLFGDEVICVIEDAIYEAFLVIVCWNWRCCKGAIVDNVVFDTQVARALFSSFLVMFFRNRPCRVRGILYFPTQRMNDLRVGTIRSVAGAKMPEVKSMVQAVQKSSSSQSVRPLAYVSKTPNPTGLLKASDLVYQIVMY